MKPLALSWLSLAVILAGGRPEATAQGTAAAPAAKKSSPVGRKITIAMKDGLRFEPARVAARPGEKLLFEIENRDMTDMTHNFLVLRPGTRESVVQAALALAGNGPVREFIPASADVLAHSPLLKSDEISQVAFQLPSEPGVYPFVCTFPGHGLVMYGAIYSGTAMPALAQDPNIPATTVQQVVAGGGRRPFAQRTFMPDAGPAAIAVALPGSQNLCWDAGECRLRYAWQGPFIDATGNLQGNGNELTVVLGRPWWRSQPGEFPLRFGRADAPRPAVKFLGYEMTPDGPRFLYRANGHEISEQPMRADRPGLAIRFRISGPPEAVFFRGDSNPDIQWSSSAGTWRQGVLSLPASAATEFTVTIGSALCQP